MATSLHRDLPFGELHPIHSLEFADAATRSSYVGTTSDIGRVARQLDDGSFWVLTSTPSTWLSIVGGGGGGVSDHGALTGLSDDDHAQYLNESRHDGLPADNPHGVTAAQTGALQSVSGDSLPQLGGPLDAQQQKISGVESITYEPEHSNGNSGATPSIDWGNGQKQSIVLDAAATISFVSPAGPANFMLILIQDSVGGRTVTWPASVLWPGAVPPILSSTPGAIDIIALYFDGASYYGVASLNFG